MGVEVSRQSDLPKGLDDDEVKKQIINSWPKAVVKRNNFMQGEEYRSTIREEILAKAGQLMAKYFEQHKDLNVLDIFAGNTKASSVLYSEMKTSVDTWRCTDVANWLVHKVDISPLIFHQLNALKAVKVYENLLTFFC